MTTDHGGDLLDATRALIEVRSESFDEAELADLVERRLRSVADSREHFSVDRVGDNVVARTHLGRRYRLVLGGHLDTVPANGNEHPRVDGDRLWGLGATDMKGGLAVMLDLVDRVPEPALDVTWVFYAREEVATVHSGLLELERERPDLLAGDVALLGEPTDGAVEAGCQGSVRVDVHLGGRRAHTARAWMGANAIHRAGSLLTRLDGWSARQPTIDGCTYHEALQAVAVTGGIAGNVVPDSVTVTIAHRFAPDRSLAEAEEWLRDWLAPSLEPDDRVEVVDRARAAPPGLTHPVLARPIERHGLEVRAKLGWTDAAFFAERGIPAANFGPGDPVLAHTAGEYLERSSIEGVSAVLVDLLTEGVPEGG
ncbi:MAG: succinyl-diaminopimelate desuccinylase [Microthrixaceae bacterium]